MNFTLLNKYSSAQLHHDVNVVLNEWYKNKGSSPLWNTLSPILGKASTEQLIALYDAPSLLVIVRKHIRLQLKFREIIKYADIFQKEA